MKTPLFIIPVLLSFCVMSFLELVGIIVEGVSSDQNNYVLKSKKSKYPICVTSHF